MLSIPAPPTVAVLLPGSGSDHEFVRSVFERPLSAIGVRLIAPPPRPGAEVATELWRALDAAAPAGALVGGVSLGAHVAARWAARAPARCAGVLAVMPAWIGEPDAAPAVLAARASAHAVRRDGLEATLAAVRAGAPGWLADELTRAWRGYGAALAPSLDAAASTPAPSTAQLRALTVPVGIAAVTDDPVHPYAVAAAWAAHLPRAGVVNTSLAAVGRDREALGRAAILAWLRSAAAGAHDGDHGAAGVDRPGGHRMVRS